MVFHSMTESAESQRTVDKSVPPEATIPRVADFAGDYGEVSRGTESVHTFRRGVVQRWPGCPDLDQLPQAVLAEVVDGDSIATL